MSQLFGIVYPYSLKKAALGSAADIEKYSEKRSLSKG